MRRRPAQVPEGGPSAAPLAAALSAARRHPAASRPGPLPGVLLGDGIQAKHHAGAPLMVYSLPATACQPPLQVRGTAGPRGGEHMRFWLGVFKSGL